MDALAHEPTPVAPRAARSAGGDVRALRLSGAPDARSLGEELERTWIEARGAHRAAAFALSLVETCGRTRAERERDARRLLRLEADVPGLASRGRLRATLVGIDPQDHLLLLTGAPDVLDAAVERLARRWPVAPLEG